MSAIELLVIAGLVVLGASLTIGFLLGVSCWQEREARRVRREIAQRRWERATLRW